MIRIKIMRRNGMTVAHDHVLSIISKQIMERMEQAIWHDPWGDDETNDNEHKVNWQQEGF